MLKKFTLKKGKNLSKFIKNPQNNGDTLSQNKQDINEKAPHTDLIEDEEGDKVYELPILSSKTRNTAIEMFKKALSIDLDELTRKRREGRVNSIVIGIESGINTYIDHISNQLELFKKYKDAEKTEYKADIRYFNQALGVTLLIIIISSNFMFEAINNPELRIKILNREITPVEMINANREVIDFFFINSYSKKPLFS